MESLELFQKFVKVINVYSERMREAERYGDILLHTSELHLLERIGDNPDTRASLLAEIMGVSKGRVSQLAKNLFNRKLIQIFSGKDKKEILYRLTPQGLKIYKEHKIRDAGIINPIIKTLESMDDETRSALNRVLDVSLRSMANSSNAEQVYNAKSVK